MKLFSFTFLLILVISSCKTIDSEYFNKDCENSKGFFIDATNISTVKNFIENDTFLSLRPLNIPSDTFCLRIGHTLHDTVYVFEYSIYKSSQSFKVFRFPIKHHYVIMFDKNKDDLKKFTTVYNSLGVENSFINVLEKNEILKLPDFDSIPGYNAGDGNQMYVIQFSNKCKYKLVICENPYSNRQFKETKALYNFLDYLRKEFDFR